MLVRNVDHRKKKLLHHAESRNQSVTSNVIISSVVIATKYSDKLQSSYYRPNFETVVQNTPGHQDIHT